MPRRVIAAVVAGLLAVVGATVLVVYVSGADARAMAGLDTVDVLVVTKPVPEGTSAADLTGSVKVTALPAAAVAPGALTDLEGVTDLVTTTNLVVGEQLLPERFAKPDSVKPAGTVDVPTGMQEVSIRLEAQRALGGRIEPGQHVGVLISLSDPDRTALSLQQVLVTRVLRPVAAEGQTDTSTAQSADGDVLVTLALAAPDAETLVFGSEHGTVWLSLQNDATSTDAAAVVTQESVLQ